MRVVHLQVPGWRKEGNDTTSSNKGKTTTLSGTRPFEILAKAPNRPATAHIRLTSLGKTMLWQRIHHRLCRQRCSNIPGKGPQTKRNI